MPTAPPKTSPSSSANHGLRRWRRVQAFGGFALVCSFFLPAVRACSSVHVPAEHLWEKATSASTHIVQWPLLFVFFAAPYLFGLLSSLLAMRRANGSPKQGARLDTAVSALLGVVIAFCLVTVVLTVRSGRTKELSFAVFCVFAMLSSAYWLRGIRMGTSGKLCLRWYTALSCVGWFSIWIIGGDSLYGAWISCAGSCMILLGCFREACIRGVYSKRDTLWALITCRLRLYDLDRSRCQACGYLLIELTTPRCPECGRPFDPEENNLAKPASIPA